ncbi:gamma-mobile-trio recombinase GmtY [Marinobacter sp. ATCH36]|uniref:gamma-mobile-trio recombinase GmtY n=1 Tax=Marinobacter sp. ATCH36 TaxID=2945106 RepID=UPI00202107BA|nr:gamma-mobile-trio recombinase GmtY [Marinobacter sp. ATCH36]MCL7942965.1 gamma-mobile-trio recombinase GmtY [Marinobacter sp. ATCH36]
MKHTLKLAVYYTDTASGIQHQLPAVYTRSGILISHLRYLAWHSGKSDSWKEKSIFAVRLLIDYVEATPGFRKATRLLKSFTEALITGTIDYQTSDDPLRLFWKPRDLTVANNILFHITHYTDFLALQDGYDQSRINPFREATGWEERMNWCAYYHKQANVFLNHLSSYSEAQKAATRKRLIYTPVPMLISNDKAERFPEDNIERLIHAGFVARGKPDFRSQAMTMLLNYGGLRKSEIFHIFTSDITIHPNHSDEALVRVYHPIYGRSPDPSYKNRAEFLLSETNFKPRNTYRITERLYSGWKNPLMTSKEGYFEVLFNPTYKAKEFLKTWAMYLKCQRVEPDNFHPFAFTNDRGEPDTLKNFQRRHKRAVERIGLECKKEFGTTEHGHRHAYGYRARKLGLSQVELQKAMHHKSPNSCLIYIKPTSDDIRTEMRESEK